VDQVDGEGDAAEEDGVGVRENAAEGGGEVDCEDQDCGADEGVCPAEFPWN